MCLYSTSIIKEEFESSTKLTKTENLAKYLEKLITIKDILKEDLGHEKTDQDILDQLIKVLNSDYDWTRNEIKKIRRNKEDIDLDEIQDKLEERFLELKSEVKKKKPTQVISVDSSGGNEEVLNIMDASYESQNQLKVSPATQNATNGIINNHPYFIDKIL